MSDPDTAARTPAPGDAVLANIARAIWDATHGDADCPGDAIPTEAALGEWLRAGDYPDEVVIEANQHLGRVYPGAVWIAPEPTDRIRGYPDRELPPVVAVLNSVLQAVIPELSKPDKRKRRGGTYQTSVFALEDVDSQLAKVCKDTGESLLHPAAPLVRAWQSRPKIVETDRNYNGILPISVATVRDLKTEQATLFSTLPQSKRPGRFETGELFGNLPENHDPSRPRNSVIPASLPLVVYDAAGGKNFARGRGAPLPLRLWVEVLLSVRPEDRRQTTRLRVELRDLVSAVWPNGWSGPAIDGNRLLRALVQIDRMFVPWEGGYWKAVRVVNIPKMDQPRDVVVIDVELPPGSDVGPMIHRPTLAKYGVDSAAGYRIYLGLSEFWNRYLTTGGKRLPPLIPEVNRDKAGLVVGADGKPLVDKAGRPAHWNDRRAVRTGANVDNPEYRRLPWLSAEDLLRLGFPMAEVSTKQQRYRRLADAKRALQRMDGDGDVILETATDGRRWRVLPPRNWGRAGDGEDAGGDGRG